MAKNPLQSPREDDVRPDEFIKMIKKEPQDEGLQNIPVGPGNYKKFKGNDRSIFPKGIAWGIAGLIVLFIGGSIASFYIFRAHFTDSVSTNITNLLTGIGDLKNLDTKGAADQFSTLNIASSGIGALFGSGNAVSSFGDLSKNLLALTSEFDALRSGAPSFLAGSTDGQFAAGLVNLHNTVIALQADSVKLSSFASNDGPYLSLAAEVASTKQFLDVFVPWFTNPTPHHVLVLLDNPSELRPGGGFLGSYADVTLASGTITNVSVHDVADVDAAFAPNVIPPKPLQLEIKAFRPADTNWFFDYPTTASKTIQFFEKSGLYAATTTFDTAIALTPRVVSDLLSLTGPITLSKPSTTFTSDNILVQVQKIVQAGQATSATYPKKILGDLSSAIIAKLAMATTTDGGAVLGMALNWIGAKDLMIYTNDSVMENFIDTHGASGDVYDLPQKFNGDYLAVVDANVNGGKSDLYVSSTISLTEDINTDATLTSHLVIDRKHLGNTSPYSWYQTTNQDYMQIFVPDATTLVNVSGGSTRTITPLTNYSKNGYVIDPLIAAVESTEQGFFAFPSVNWHEDSGKKVFSTWSIVRAGASTELSFDYSHRLFIAPAVGAAYQFVFEKQSGASRSYDIVVNAPLGFQFLENGLPSYEYVSNDPPGRLVLNLTLEKIPQ